MSSVRITYGRWYGVCVCKACEQRLSDHDHYYSGAVCSKCGHHGRGTIADYKTVVYRKVVYWVPFLWIFRRTIKVEYERKS